MAPDDQIKDVVQSPAVAGTVGALLSLRWVPGDSWSAKAFSFAGGMAVAIFLAPLAIEIWGLKSQAGQSAFSFVAGLLGANLLNKAWMYVAESNFGELVTQLVNVFRKQP